MAKRMIAVFTLAVLLGVGALAIRAEAYSNCTTTCTGYGNYRTCNTYCY